MTPIEKQQAVFDAAKAGSAWTFAGLTANEIASFLAGFYSCLLICEWLWRKVIRRQLLRWGIVRGARIGDA